MPRTQGVFEVRKEEGGTETSDRVRMTGRKTRSLYGANKCGVPGRLSGTHEYESRKISKLLINTL